LNEPDRERKIPNQILEQVISAVETRHPVGLNALLYCARRLAELNQLSMEGKLRVDEALGDLLTEAAYETIIDFESHEATSVSLVRAECVRLARTLKDAGWTTENIDAWLNVAQTDVLPEVRYALA
jgi:hypothetical protein